MTRSELRAALEGGDPDSLVILDAGGDFYQVREIGSAFSGEIILHEGDEYYDLQMEDESGEDDDSDPML
jgi:hypothetical protein